MRALKNARTVAASLAVLAVSSVASSPAMAFDRVDWKWNTDVKEKVDIDVYVDVDVETTGLVQIEKLQIYLGDAKASSYVSNIKNDPIRPTEWKGYGWHSYKVTKPLDARTQLPIVQSSATAVGNNQSITSDVAVMLHDGQFVANVRDANCLNICDALSLGALAAALPGVKDFIGGSNLHTDIAGLFTVGAAVGAFEKSAIRASSAVNYVRNVSVDSSATAVANNLSVDVASDVDGGKCGSYGFCGDRLSNHVVIGDITQFALANVSASSRVTDVKASGYENMRQLTTATLSPIEGGLGNVVQVPTPWVSSVASAIGNNVAITVGRDLRP
jgi:hypothetical protein